MRLFKNYIKKSKIKDRITELTKVCKEVNRGIRYGGDLQKQTNLHAMEKQLEYCIHELKGLL